MKQQKQALQRIFLASFRLYVCLTQLNTYHKIKESTNLQIIQISYKESRMLMKKLKPLTSYIAGTFKVPDTPAYPFKSLRTSCLWKDLYVYNLK